MLQLFKQRVGLPRAAISALLAGPLMLASTAAAQLFSAKQGAIVYGHHHLYVTSIPDDKKFFIDALGGKSVKVGTSTAEVVEFPNVFIFFTPQPPTGGTKGTTVVKIFGAQPQSRGILPSATLPGVVFYFAHSDSPVAPTRGRAIDHIGFEVQNLAEFCKNLEAQGIKLDSPYRPAPAFNTHTAHFTDPWGTNIELVEGMASLP